MQASSTTKGNYRKLALQYNLSYTNTINEMRETTQKIASGLTKGNIGGS